MKKIIFYTVLLLIFSVSCAMAEVYLIVDKDTDQIVSMSEKDDAVMPAGNYEKVVIQEDFNKIRLTALVTDYKYINGNFVKNIDKISDRENVRIREVTRLAEIKLIQDRLLKDMCDTMVTEGTVFQVVKCTDF